VKTKRVKFRDVPIGRVFVFDRLLWIRYTRKAAVTIPLTACGACAFLREIPSEVSHLGGPGYFIPADDTCEFVELVDEIDMANLLYAQMADAGWPT
jgi:hypothetical protein